MDRAVVIVKAATLNGEAHFGIEQLEGELNLKEVAQLLELASQFIYKQFPHLKDDE